MALGPAAKWRSMSFCSWVLVMALLSLSTDREQGIGNREQKAAGMTESALVKNARRDTLPLRPQPRGFNEPARLTRGRGVRCDLRPRLRGAVWPGSVRAVGPVAAGRSYSLRESSPGGRKPDPVLCAYAGIPAMRTAGDRRSPAHPARNQVSGHIESGDDRVPIQHSICSLENIAGRC